MKKKKKKTVNVLGLVRVGRLTASSVLVYRWNHESVSVHKMCMQREMEGDLYYKMQTSWSKGILGMTLYPYQRQWHVFFPQISVSVLAILSCCYFVSDFGLLSGVWSPSKQDWPWPKVKINKTPPSPLACEDRRNDTSCGKKKLKS